MLFCYVSPAMGPGQWADTGMYLQTVMLLLRAEGLHSCRTVGDGVGVEGLVLLCGVAVGHEDEAVPRLRTQRADLTENVAFLGI